MCSKRILHVSLDLVKYLCVWQPFSSLSDIEVLRGSEKCGHVHGNCWSSAILRGKDKLVRGKDRLCSLMTYETAKWQNFLRFSTDLSAYRATSTRSIKQNQCCSHRLDVSYAVFCPGRTRNGHYIVGWVSPVTFATFMSTITYYIMAFDCQ